LAPMREVKPNELETGRLHFRWAIAQSIAFAWFESQRRVSLTVRGS